MSVILIVVLFVLGQKEDSFVSPASPIQISHERLLKLARLEGSQDVTLTENYSTREPSEFGDAVTALHKGIRSLYVEYSFHYNRIANISALPDGLKQLPDDYSVSARGAFDRLLLFQDSTRTKLDLAPRLFVFDGEKSIVLSRGVAKISPGRRNNNFLPTRNLLRNLFLFITPDERLAIDSTKWYLPKSIEKYSDYLNVLPFQERVDEINCHVLNFDNQMYFWCESNSPHRILRYVRLSVGQGTGKPGGLRQIFQFKEFVTLGSRSMPKHVEILDYGTVRGETHFGQLESIRTYDVSRMEINKVDPQLFTIAIPGNTEVHDSVNRKSYVTPATVRQMEETIDLAIQEIEPTVPFSWISYFLIFVCTLGFIVCVLSLRGFATPQKSKSNDE